MLFNNFMFFEPLEQFEIVKINYEWWFNNSIIETIVFLLNDFLNCDHVFIFDISSDFVNNYLNMILLFWAVCDVRELANLLNLENSYDSFNFFVWPAEFFSNYDFFLNYDFFDSLLFNDSFVTSSNILAIWGYTFNSTIYYLFLLITVLLFLLFPVVNNLSIIPNNWQMVFENLYKFVADMLAAQVGKEAQRFFPYIFSIFLFILISNMLGMTLFSFTLTSHIMVTFTLGVSSFIGLTLLGFLIQKIHFLNLFLPKGIPAALLPMLVVIEVISYFSRALSLSIRLFANLMSGHTLLHILAFFSSKLFKYKFIIGLISFALILAIVALEFCIALLQAYVFAILICIYLNDAFHASH